RVATSRRGPYAAALPHGYVAPRQRALDPAVLGAPAAARARAARRGSAAGDLARRVGAGPPRERRAGRGVPERRPRFVGGGRELGAGQRCAARLDGAVLRLERRERGRIYPVTVARLQVLV